VKYDNENIAKHPESIQFLLFIGLPSTVHMCLYAASLDSRRLKQLNILSDFLC